MWELITGLLGVIADDKHYLIAVCLGMMQYMLTRFQTVSIKGLCTFCNNQYFCLFSIHKHQCKKFVNKSNKQSKTLATLLESGYLEPNLLLGCHWRSPIPNNWIRMMWPFNIKVRFKFRFFQKLPTVQTELTLCL